MEAKQRHGCLTAWLILMMIGNALNSLIYLFSPGMMQQAYPDAPGWAFIALALIGFANLAAAIALWKWQKWGFYLFAGFSVVTLFVNIIVGIPIALAVFGLVGIAMLYGVLQIGKENKGWPQLN